MTVKLSRLHDQYVKLQRRFHPERDVAVMVSELVEALGCTARNVRLLLREMAALGWIRWEPAQGRGRTSRLMFLRAAEQLPQQELRQLLESGRLAEMLSLVEGDTKALESSLNQFLGAVTEGENRIVRVPWYRSISLLEPWKPQRRTERHLLRQCFAGLTRYDARQGRVVPDLAHHWKHDEERRVWDFFLKSGLKFSDGSVLDASDVERCISALTRSPVFSRLYQDVESIAVIDRQQLRIALRHPNHRFADLLSHASALIYGNSRGKTLYTGPWQVKSHDGFSLVMRVNPWYYGVRPVIDEVSIMKIESDILDMGRIQVFYQGMQQAGPPSRQERIERGSCFLVVDGAGRFTAEEDRVFLNHVLQPVDILKNASHQRKMHLALSVAQGLLPGWYHRLLDIVPPLRQKMYRDLTLATFEQPELARHAEGIINILERYGIRCRLIVKPYQAFFTAPPTGVDLWLSNVVLDDASDYAVNAWIQSDPILERSGRSWLQERAEVGRGINTGQATCETALEKLVRDWTEQRWFIPLVYHLVDREQFPVVGNESTSELGWINFSEAWFDIR
ncbi:SgrR family transcriptional regulator [Serratia ficaria]|uniref:SgrR family transcriptional regulator n=1 Tax=Serratia ficaria TaxID=61651 RepID=UPI00217BBFDB|nr:SgrR family transcriptional regulator [Serratia ficaria]CAI0797295.1 HTH-type transcriptional regulator sgrR [Serratia ficaria]CAI1662575.1 HTH-type transcriptional regulator sgrR [Serratia ficaria]